ncbi:MAG TPA: cytochrome c peroxidase, partial [Gemmataceae bacterium]|nr:cytochrome c peroxidase [Gemmataceae bacterium]
MSKTVRCVRSSALGMDDMCVALLWGIVAWSALVVSLAGAAPLERSSRLRRPVAAGLLADGHTLCVANRSAGSLSLVDLAQGHVQCEIAVGQCLAGLAVLPDRKHVLVVDEQGHELIALVFEAETLRVCARLPVGPYPVSVTVTADGTRATVAGLWSRRLEVVDLTPLASPAGPAKLRVLHVVGFPFAPRLQCMMAEPAAVIVADGFGGHLAVVDVAGGRLRAEHEFAGHNLRGLALDASRSQLVLAHQILNEHAATTRENIERGVLMANVLQEFPLDQVRTPGAHLEATGRRLPLGTERAGAGDPAGIALLDDGEIAVALAGVNELAILRTKDGTHRRIPVGRRPTAVVAVPGQGLVVLDTFSDALSVIDPRRGTVVRTIPLGPQPELTAKERGELLFFDARLGRDGWLSCHSCHSDGHSNGLQADTLGDNTYGTPKRTLTLMNTALTDPWAWNGEMKYLHDQVHKSLVDTMQTPSLAPEQIDDLVAFLHSLPPPPPA